MLNDLARAQLSGFLATLENKKDATIGKDTLRHIIGQQGVDEIESLYSDYKAANDAAKEDGGAFLSAEAADYWQEAQGVLAYGRLALSMGSKSAEKVLSGKCERLTESFDQRVPDNEKGKFIQHSLEDGAGWDDRWHSTMDFTFPLLNTSFTELVPVAHPRAEAQRTVLRALLETGRTDQTQAENVSRLGSMLKKFTDDHEETVQNLVKKAHKKAKAQAKREEEAKKKADHERLVLHGDPAACRRENKRRASQLKPAGSMLFLQPKTPRAGKPKTF